MAEFPFVSPPVATTTAFVVVLFAVQLLVLYAVYQTAAGRGAIGRRRVLLAAGMIGIGMGVSALLAESGLLDETGTLPPRIGLLAIASNLVALVLAVRGPGRAMALAVSPAFWVLFQGFRVPLEVILHLWNRAGTIPEQMTWHGQNPDIVSGLIGLALGTFYLRRPSAHWAGFVAHGIGLVLLFNVARVALFSAPTPFKAFEGPPLLLAYHAPYVWIIPFAVATAFFGHLVGLRAIRFARHENGAI